jgi:PAS domain S-box-containing protein
VSGREDQSSAVHHLDAQLPRERNRSDYLLREGTAIVYACEAKPPFAVTFVSANVQTKLGFAPSRFTDSPDFWSSRIHPDDAPRALAALPELFETGFHRHEYRFRTASGGYRWMRDELRLILDDGDQPVEIIGNWADVTDQQEDIRALARAKQLLTGVSVLQNRSFQQTDDQEPFELLLSLLLEATESEHGFVGEVCREADGSPYLKAQAVTNIAWVPPTQALCEASADSDFEFRNLNNLFGAVLTTGEVVIENDVHADARAGGLPPGYAPLHAFLGVPIKVGDELLGMMGVGNRRLGYDEQNVEDLAPLLATYGSLIVARRDELHRRAAEELLRESEERHRLIIESSRYAIMTLGPPSWRFESCNPAALALYGVESEERFCELGTWDLSPALQPDGNPSSESLASKVETAMLQGLCYFEWMHERSDGALFPATVMLSQMEQGGRVFLQATVRDITQEKKDEATLRNHGAVLRLPVGERTAELKESERFARTALDALASHIVILDHEGVVLHTNAAWDSYGAKNGLAPGYAAVGQNYLSACRSGGDEGRVALDTVQDVISGRRAEAVFEYACHSPHEERWFLCRITRFSGSLSVRVAVEHADITMRKRAELIAGRSRKRFGDLFEFAPDAIVMSDSSGIIKDTNRQAEVLFGYEREDLVGQPSEVLMPISLQSVPAESVLPSLRSDIVGGGVRAATARGLHKDGSEFPIEVSVARLGSEPAVTVTAVRDVTERIRVAEELEASLREKDILLREIHHRVKNNLQIISSLLRMQSEAADPVTRGVLQDSVHRVRSMGLIHERLYQSHTLARIEFGEYAQDLAGVLVRSYDVANVVRLITKVEPVDIDIDTAIPLGLILNELVSNALKYAFSDGGSGDLRVEIDSTPEFGFRMTVADSGPGLPSGFLIDYTQSMGLQLVSSLVRQVRGELTIKNRPGALFRVTIKDVE